MPEERQVITIPFTAGLDTKSDPRAAEPSKLTIARDIQFDLLGGIQTRYPYSAIGTNILGGGTLSNYRRIFEGANGELLCFTIDTLYSWDSRDSVWVPRGTHLAVALNEQTQFATTDDQTDCDRAELSGTVVYAWTGTTTAFVAAIDKATGAVILGPTDVRTFSVNFDPTPSRMRLVACQTRILLIGNFNVLGSNKLWCIPIDPANVLSSLNLGGAAISSLTTYNNASFDVVQVPGADQAAGAFINASGDYTLFTVTSGLTVVTSAKSRVASTCVGVSCTPDGIHIQVVRDNTGAGTIQGDLCTISSLADVFTAQNLGSLGLASVFQIAIAHRSVKTSGQYRAYVFASLMATSTGPSNGTFVNWVDDGGNIGSAPGGSIPVANGYWYLVPASRAFTYNGSVYFWATFGEASVFTGSNNASFVARLQSSYFLIRDDGFLAAKATYESAGGYAVSTGRLPGVAATSDSPGLSFAWCGGINEVVDLGGTDHIGYSRRAPRDIVFTFDSNDARRVVRLGNTMYIACAEGCLQYDGQQLVEVGFHVYPWTFAVTEVGSGGSMPTGMTWAWKLGWRWQNARGDVERSTSATTVQATSNFNSDSFTFTVSGTLSVTHKTTPAIGVDYWRSPANPTASSPFYLVSSQSPSNATNPNRYIPNINTSGALATFTDGEADSTATTNMVNPENSAVLPSLSAPAAKFIAATQYQLFIGGIAGAPDTFWYSKQRSDGQVAAFSDTLTADIPSVGGQMTGVVYHSQANALVAFRQRAVYALTGTGYDNLGNGTNFVVSQTLSTDVGCVSPDAFVLGPFGIIFKSNKGWYLLDGSLGLKYIGGGAKAFDGDTVYAMHVMQSTHQVRIVTNNRVIVFDYLVGEWMEWTIATGVHACMWNGQYVYLDSVSGPMLEQSTYAAVSGYGMDVELAFLKPAGFVGRFNARWIEPLGEYRSSCLARIRVARDYQQDGAGNWSYFDDVVKTPAAVVGGPMQVRHGPSQQSGLEAIKVRITAISATLASIALTSGGTTVTVTSRIGTSAGNALSLAHSSSTTISAADSGGNLITLSGPSTLTAQQIVDALTRDSLLVSAAITAGSGSTTYNLSAFTGSLTGGVDWPTGEAMRLTAIGFELGGLPGVYTDLAAAQEQ